MKLKTGLRCTIQVRMLRPAAALWLLGAVLCRAEDKWEECRSGPFEVWTSDDDRHARVMLVRLEQIRHMIGVYTGKQDPVSLWTLRVLLDKNKAAAATDWKDGRDAWVSLLPAQAAPSRAWQKEVVKRLLESNVRRMPGGWENGLIDLLSTLEAKGPVITLGAPPPAAERTRDWARVHMLATNPEYSSRLRVLMNNLQNGGEEDVAFRNSLGMPRAELEKLVDAYMAAGKYAPANFSGRAMSERDFYTRPIEAPRALASLADATGNARLPASGSMESAEALGLEAARAGRKQEALDWLKQAIAAESKSARVHLEYGKLLTDPEAKRAAYVEAGKRNPKWPQPYVELANTETAPSRQAFYLKSAAALDPRNSELWQRLGRAQLEAGEYGDAAKSWFAAELAAPTTQERETVRQARLRFEEERAEREAAERKRVADEKKSELDRLKQEALNRVREAEARANQSLGGPTSSKVENWWEDGKPKQKAAGVFERMECIGKRARIWIRPAAGKHVALQIVDPSQIVIIGQGSAALGCGIQKPARQVTIEYTPRVDAKFGTAGDVAMIEFAQ